MRVLLVVALVVAARVDAEAGPGNEGMPRVGTPVAAR